MCVCVCVFGRSRKPSFVTCGLSTLTRASIKSSQLWHVVEMDGRTEWCLLLENEDIHQVLRNCSDGQYFTTNLEWWVQSRAACTQVMWELKRKATMEVSFHRWQE